MRRSIRTAPLAAAAALGLALLAAPRAARAAGEIQAAVGLGGQGSSWRGDGSGFGAMKIGFRFADVVAPYFLFRFGYANVDERFLTHLSLGLQAWLPTRYVRPYARFGFVHQHEETWSSVKAEPFGTIFGVGDGIRHRGGFDGALGVDIPFTQHKAWQFHFLVEGVVTGFPDEKGPPVYGGAMAGLGFNYHL
ncbi:MAG: hypothetical protein U0359_36695 [Byssovorax sp.]